MYILDTNVISELRRGKRHADKSVLAWAASVPVSSLFLSVITILELEIGTLLMERKDEPQGAMLRQWLNNHVLKAFDNRILPIDTSVVQQCAVLHVPQPRSDRDALIAATALVHSMTVITRNVTHFSSMGVKLHNPWI